ncbi:MAG: S9 family peptidase [Deltaproteobacteria bacterium]|nr:S9 family peptidase [Deltaproteobacteria bacterium]
MTAPSAAATFSIDDFVSLRRVGALAVHPDETWAAVVVERLDADRGRYVSDLWRVSLVDPAARPERLTRGHHRDKAPAFAADGTLCFLSDRAPEEARKGEDEKRLQVWALGAHGEPRQLSDEPLGVTELRVGGATIAAMTRALPGKPRDTWREAQADRKKHGPSALTWTTMPVRFWDHWLGPTEPRLVVWDLAALPAEGPLPAGRELTTDGEGRALHEASWDLSADGLTLAVTWAKKNPSDRIDDTALVLIDLATGARTTIGEAPGVVHGALALAPDGAHVVASRYTRGPRGYGARSLWCYDRIGAARELTGDWDRWPVPRAFTPDGAAVIATVEDEGRVRLARVTLSGERALLGPARGSWHDIAVTARGVVGPRSAIDHPPEVFTLAWGDSEPVACAALSGFRPEAAPVTVVDRRFAVDGREIQAWVVEPGIETGAPPTRTLFWIHGGPVAAWLDQWHWRWSPTLAAAHGYRAVLPNPAGSTGFGLAWVDDVWGNTWGARCYADLMGVVDRLEQEGVPARDTVVMGGSFGGYMTNWIGGRTDRFRALVTHASLFHLSTFHLATDVPAWWELMLGGTMWSDPALHDADLYSPSRQIDRWRTPTLILHGEKDYRVPITEGLMLFEALQRRGVPSELVVFPDEHHWILKPQNVAAWYRAVFAFLDRHWG